MTIDKEKLLDIIDSLQPTTEEYGDNERFFHWMDYACELDAVNDFVLTANERGYEIV